MRNNVAQSNIHPGGLNNPPAARLGPTAGVKEMERYDTSFKGEEEKATEMRISY